MIASFQLSMINHYTFIFFQHIQMPQENQESKNECYFKIYNVILLNYLAANIPYTTLSTGQAKNKKEFL